MICQGHMNFSWFWAGFPNPNPTCHGRFWGPFLGARDVAQAPSPAREITSRVKMMANQDTQRRYNSASMAGVPKQNLEKKKRKHVTEPPK